MSRSSRPFVPGLTIDPEGAPDLDDAIAVEKLEAGWRVRVSIADVAEHVPAGSCHDQQARQRAFTRYLADTSEPMLPKELAEDGLSLLGGQVRDTITFTLEVNAGFEVTGLDIEPTRLQSEAQLTYEAVTEALDTPEDPCHPYWHDVLALAYGLLARRQQRGALAVFDPASAVRSTEEGKLIRLPEGKAHRAYLIVQERRASFPSYGRMTRFLPTKRHRMTAKMS